MTNSSNPKGIGDRTAEQQKLLIQLRRPYDSIEYYVIVPVSASEGARANRSNKAEEAGTWLLTTVVRQAGRPEPLRLWSPHSVDASAQGLS
ncbi:hypothetical protein PSPO01_16216 [Paraphaeosphaeria sporulosa]